MTIVRQRADADCAAASLSSYTGESYEDVYLHVARVDPVHRGKNGLHNREVIAAARLMGLRLKPVMAGRLVGKPPRVVLTHHIDLDEDEGILRIRFHGARRKHLPGGHFTVLRGGQIFCPADVSVLPYQDYFDRWQAYPCTLLREVR